MNTLDKDTALMKKVEKGWGHELWIHNDEEYCGKLLYFNEGKRCSLHYHERKKETFYLQSGKLECTFYHLDHPEIKNTVILEAGDSKKIPRRLVHQMIALEDTVLFEFSTQHFDEDSIRLQKGD